MQIKILIFILLLIPSVSAWSWNTHQNIVEYVYLNLEPETQQQLNLTRLREGAVIPDKDFKDHRLHHYPKSLAEAEKWLNNDSDLSLNIGIASHYITDSFAAPHNILGEDYNQHAKFEKQVEYYYPNVECRDYNFSLNDLKISTKNSKDWDEWLKTKKKKLPQKEVDEATGFLFSIISKKLDAKCNVIKTRFFEKPYLNKNKILIISIVLIASLCIVKTSRKFL